MNRENLFKAKRKDNGEWVEGYYVYCRKRHYILPVLNKAIGFDEREDKWIEIDIDTLCQHTGLTDKNDKKIWENDILRRDGYWDIRIEFENGVFMVRNTDKVQYINRVVYTPISIFDVNVYEVIGNIFDNPELLEVR
ncbi:hypothetical protein DWY90_09970 [Coprococcus sp. AF27-8]|nr:hypothetical protein DWY90_09970 [Coprococcus sp. AF27-8]